MRRKGPPPNEIPVARHLREGDRKGNPGVYENRGTRKIDPNIVRVPY